MNMKSKLLVIPPFLLALKQVHEEIKDKPCYKELCQRLSSNFNNFTVKAASDTKTVQSGFIPTFPLPENAEYAGDLGCRKIKHTRKRLYVAHLYKGVTKKTLQAHNKHLKSYRIDPNADLVYCPSPLHLNYVKKSYPDSISLGIQNIYPSEYGNYTGEVSLPMAKDMGVQYVLVGAAHRRAFFGETNKFVQAKVRKALNNDMKCLVFICNTTESNDDCSREITIKNQLKALFPAIELEEWNNIALAYESFSNKDATTEEIVKDAQKSCKLIRDTVSRQVGNDISQRLRILYSGEVDHNIAPEIMAEEDVDGLVFSPRHNNECFINVINSGLLADKRKENMEQPKSDNNDKCITIIEQ